nr:MAG: capsid protein [Cressdnaviricota sp.]
MSVSHHRHEHHAIAYPNHGWKQLLKSGVKHAIKHGGKYLTESIKKKRKMHPTRGVSNEDGASNVNAVSTGHVSHVRGVAMKKHKTPKVSKAFKEKVAAATRSKDMTGFKEDIFYQALKGFPDNKQGVGWSATPSQPFPAGTMWSFLPEYFLDAASVLWNQKPPGNGPWSITDNNNIGSNPTTASGSQAANSAKFTVINSFEHYKIRNNTNRAFHIKLYECRPKRVSNVAVASKSILNAAVTVEDALLDPAAYWAQCMANDVVEGYNLGTAGGTFAATPTTYGATPSLSPMFAKGYAVGCTEVFLEPGATYSYFLQGPSNLEVDFKKYYTNDVFSNIQKYSRYLLPVVFSELVANDGFATGQVLGRLNFIQGAIAGNYLYCERKMYCKMKMPEEAGFTATTQTAGSRYLDNRKDSMCYQNWGSYGVAAGGVANHDVERQTAVNTLI